MKNSCFLAFFGTKICRYRGGSDSFVKYFSEEQKHRRPGPQGGSLMAQKVIAVTKMKFEEPVQISSPHVFILLDAFLASTLI